MKNLLRVKVLPLLGLAAIFLVGSTSNAFADLIFVSDIQVTGTGLGAVNTIVTVHDPGGPGNQNGTESGCINQNGSFAPCLGSVEGGDNTAINNVITLNNDFSFAAVVNISETGQDVTVTLTDLYLTFCGANGCHTAFYNGPDLNLTQGTGTGLGASGFTFALNATEAATVAALGPSLTISGGVQFANGSTNDGNDTLHVIQVAGGQQVVPEPGSLILLGSGLLGIGRLARRRFFGRQL